MLDHWSFPGHQLSTTTCLIKIKDTADDLPACPRIILSSAFADLHGGEQRMLI